MSTHDTTKQPIFPEAHDPTPAGRVARASQLIVATLLFAACEQQVANAEQPSAAAVVAPASTAETSGAALQEPAHPKGKLVFDKPACQLPNRGGEVTGDCSVLARIGPERSGHLTYGPYAPLPAGEYTFELDYRSSAPAATPAGQWDAAARLGNDESIVAQGSILGSGNAQSTLVGHFSMPQKNGVPVIEIRMSPALTAETEIKALRIYEDSTLR